MTIIRNNPDFRNQTFSLNIMGGHDFHHGMLVQFTPLGCAYHSESGYNLCIYNIYIITHIILYISMNIPYRTQGQVIYIGWTK